MLAPSPVPSKRRFSISQRYLFFADFFPFSVYHSARESWSDFVSWLAYLIAREYHGRGRKRVYREGGRPRTILAAILHPSFLGYKIATPELWGIPSKFGGTQFCSPGKWDAKLPRGN